jgi:hypothetical protein
MNVQDEVFNEENESASNIAEDARMEEPLQVRVSSFLLFTPPVKSRIGMHYGTVKWDNAVTSTIFSHNLF